VLDESLAESQAEWGAANAEYNANILRLQQETEALKQKAQDFSHAQK
jgi:phage host-nuclease inhibitor protein Gam